MPLLHRISKSKCINSWVPPPARKPVINAQGLILPDRFDNVFFGFLSISTMLAQPPETSFGAFFTSRKYQYESLLGFVLKRPGEHLGICFSDVKYPTAPIMIMFRWRRSHSPGMRLKSAAARCSLFIWTLRIPLFVPRLTYFQANRAIPNIPPGRLAMTPI